MEDNLLELQKSKISHSNRLCVLFHFPHHKTNKISLSIIISRITNIIPLSLAHTITPGKIPPNCNRVYSQILCCVHRKDSMQKDKHTENVCEDTHGKWLRQQLEKKKSNAYKNYHSNRFVEITLFKINNKKKGEIVTKYQLSWKIKELMILQTSYMPTAVRFPSSCHIIHSHTFTTYTPTNVGFLFCIFALE